MSRRKVRVPSQYKIIVITIGDIVIISCSREKCRKPGCEHIPQAQREEVLQRFEADNSAVQALMDGRSSLHDSGSANTTSAPTTTASDSNENDESIVDEDEDTVVPQCLPRSEAYVFARTSPIDDWGRGEIHQFPFRNPCTNANGCYVLDSGFCVATKEFNADLQGVQCQCLEGFDPQCCPFRCLRYGLGCAVLIGMNLFVCKRCGYVSQLDSVSAFNAVSVIRRNKHGEIDKENLMLVGLEVLSLFRETCQDGVSPSAFCRALNSQYKANFMEHDFLLSKTFCSTLRCAMMRTPGILLANPKNSKDIFIIFFFFFLVFS